MTQRLTTSAAARSAGTLATIAFVVAIFLQLLLAAGVVPITMAWGGTQAVLTPALRLASLAAAGLLGWFLYIIRRRAGLSGAGQPSRRVKISRGSSRSFLALNTLGNFASSSRGEAVLFGPLSLVLAVSCLIVSSSRSDR